MLTIIKIVPPPKGFRIRRKARRGKIPPRQTLSQIRGLPFRVIEITAAPKEILEHQLKGLIEPHDGVITSGLDAGVKIPCENVYDTSDLEARWLVNTAVDIMKQYPKGRRARMLLVDRPGKCAGAAAELIPYCEILVCTDRAENYENCAEYTRLKYGAEPLLTQLSHPGRIHLALAPYGLGGITIPNASTPLLSPLPQDKGYCAGKEDLALLSDIAAAAPAGIDPALFTAAVFYEGEFDEFFTVVPQRLQIRGEFVTISDFKEMVFRK